MKLKFSINRMDFISRVLSPLYRFNETVKLTISPNGDVYSMVRRESVSKSSTMLLYSEMHSAVSCVEGDFTDPVSINIGDVKKLITALNLIKDDTVDLFFDGKAIVYESPALSFRFSVLVDDVMEKSVINRKQVDMIMNDSKTGFFMEYDIVKMFISMLVCIPTCEKIWFTTNENGVKGILSDSDSGSSDVTEMMLSSSYEGKGIGADDKVIISVDLFKYLILNKFDKCHVDITGNGVVVVSLVGDGYVMRYIVPRRVK